MLTAAPLQADNGGASGNEGGEAPESTEPESTAHESTAHESAEPAPKEEEAPETAEAGTGQQEAGTGAEEPAKPAAAPKEQGGDKPGNKGSNADFSVKAENLLKKYLKL